MTVLDDDDKRHPAGTSYPAAARGLSAPEQRLIAVATAVSLVGMAAWFIRAGGGRGGLVPHDAAPRRTTGFRIDPNTASRAELMQLPGIGPKTADRILETRRSEGPFESVEALADVPGVGPVSLDRIRAFVRVSRVRPPSGPPEHGRGPPSDVRTGEPVPAGR